MVSADPSTLEPILVKVVRPSGDLVAELLASPLKPLRRLKTQIAGLEGTAIGNQALFFEGDEGDLGKALGDDTSLAAMGMTRGTATMVLVKLQPLLSGRLVPADLQHLLIDDVAMEQAIDGWKENPEYSPEEVTEILEVLAKTLLPTHAHAAQDVAAELAREPTLGCGTPDLSPGHGHGDVRTKKLKRFVCVIRAAMVLIRRRLDETCSSEEKHVEATSSSLVPEDQDAADLLLPSVTCNDEETDSRMQRLRHARIPQTHDVEIEACPDQWIGAGKELREILYRRWNATQGFTSPEPS